MRLTNDLKVIEKHLRIVETLLAGLLLRGDDRASVDRLEKLMGIRKGTLSKTFPRRQGRKKGRPKSDQGKN